MAAKVWLFTCISQIASTQAMICQNWEDEGTCVKNNDGGCGCVWNAGAGPGECIKGKICPEGMVGITSVVEPEPEPEPAPSPEPEPVTAELCSGQCQYYNLSNPSSPAQELKLPCRACKRGLFPDEEKQQAACKSAGGQVAFCDCLTVLCTVNVPADSLDMPDTKSDTSPLVTEASTTSTTSTTSITDESTSVAFMATAQAPVAIPAKLMLVCVILRCYLTSFLSQ